MIGPQDRRFSTPVENNDQVCAELQLAGVHVLSKALAQSAQPPRFLCVPEPDCEALCTCCADYESLADGTVEI